MHLVALLCGGVVQAQSTEEVLLNECVEQRTARHYVEALAACERAMQLSRNGRTLGQLGITEIAVERWRDAASHLTAAMGSEHPWVQRNRNVLEVAMTRVRPHVAELVIESEERGATALLDGRSVGLLPLTQPLFVDPGTFTVNVRGARGPMTAQRVTVRGGGREVLRFAPAPAPAETPAHAPVVEAPPVVPVVPPATEPVSSPLRPLAWVAAGGALAGFATAIVGWRMREDSVALENPCILSGGDCSAVRDDRETGVLVTRVGLVAGGVFALTSTILFIAAPSSTPAARVARSWACLPSHDHPGAQCAFHF